MTLADKTLTCRECGKNFTFTVGEQEFYKSKGLQNDPGRCPQCRAARRQTRNTNGGTSRPRTMFQTTCASCGGPAEVPFEPKQDRPVYCSACFSKSRSPS
jgi:CxxC-x17-CxxC domain-containing protein